MNLQVKYSFLLSQNNIPCDKEELEFQIRSHPSYPSLHSITGVLDHFNIDNLAIDVPITKETLSQLPKSFLAQLETEQGETFAIINNKGSKYKVLFSKKDKKQLSIHDFLKQFTGIIVVVEKTENTVIPKNTGQLFSSTPLVLSILFAVMLLANTGITIISSLYILSSIVGIYISIAIIKQELGEKTSLGETFCSNTNTKNNCGSVLSSKGAHIGKYKLSDFSVVYFSGLTLVSFLLLIMEKTIILPLIFGLIALPVTLYSVYYQYTVVKQWCLLCLSIIGVLWIQATFSFLHLDPIIVYISTSTGQDVFTVLFVFMSLFAIWNMLSPHIKRIKELKESKIKFFKFKRDFNLFQSLLNTSKTVNTSIPNAPTIVFGNPKATLAITLITNPFCGHCKPVHSMMEHLLKKYPEKIQLHIRFNVNEVNTALINITSRLLELYHQDGELRCLEAMRNIYGGLDTGSWMSKWGITRNKKHYQNILKLEHEWCKQNAINFTPKILINGKPYPKEYDRSELIYFIEELQENSNVEESVASPTVV